MQFKTITNVKPEPLLFDFIHRADHAATGDHPITTLETGQHTLRILTLLLLGAKNKKIENSN
jgi:hypothetical protein